LKVFSSGVFVADGLDLVPVAFATTVPVEALTGRLSGGTLLGAVGLAALLFAVSRLFWRIGLRRYSGTSA
jgi:ABC-2 type transport system permease protein